MQRLIFLCSIAFCWILVSSAAQAEGLVRSKSRFYYQSGSGHVSSARIVRRYFVPTVHPSAKVDSRIDPRLRRAATIAQERANARTKARCWRYVKQALVAAGAVASYPKTVFAKQAGAELTRDYGFKKLPISNPYAAPVGAVLVYTAKGPGHVEIRTKNGFVSDFRTPTPSRRKLIGIYAKA